MERNDAKTEDSNKIRAMASKIGKIGRCNLRHTEKVHPKSITCKMCSTALTNYNYQNHFTCKHNITKEEYFSHNEDQMIYKTKNYVCINNTIMTKGMIKRKDFGKLTLSQAKLLLLIKSYHSQIRLQVFADMISGRAHIETDNAYKLFEKYKELDHYLSDNFMKTGETLDFFTKRYGETIAIAKLTAKSERVTGAKNPGYQHNGKLSAWSKNFVNGYNEERHNQAKKDHSAFMKSHRHLNKFMIEYWLEETNGDVEKANKLYTKSQTRNLAWFIDKFGETEGKNRHQAKTEKWMKTLDGKPDAEKERINLLRLKGAMTNHTRSNIGNELFSEIARSCSDILFGDKEKIVRLPNNRFVRPDCLLGDKIIEFYGNYWHAHPAQFLDETAKIRTRSVKSIRERDDHRICELKKKGYRIMIVWESDYKTDKKGTIKKCLNFLQSK